MVLISFRGFYEVANSTGFDWNVVIVCTRSWDWSLYLSEVHMRTPLAPIFPLRIGWISTLLNEDAQNMLGSNDRWKSPSNGRFIFYTVIIESQICLFNGDTGPGFFPSFSVAKLLSEGKPLVKDTLIFTNSHPNYQKNSQTVELTPAEKVRKDFPIPRWGG